MFIGTQLFPGEIKYFEEILEDSFKTQEYGFLIIDLLLTSMQKIRLRTFDFKSKKAYVYVRK